MIKEFLTPKRFGFAAEDTAYARNVAALEKVQPEPLKADEISVRIGASWVDADYYKEFLMEILGIYGYYSDGLNIRYNTFDGSWKVERADHVRNNAGYRATETYGTNRANAFRLFEDCLNQRATQIFDTVEENGKEKRVLNKGETIGREKSRTKSRKRLPIGSTPIRTGARTWKRRTTACLIRYACRVMTEVSLNSPA